MEYELDYCEQNPTRSGTAYVKGGLPIDVEATREGDEIIVEAIFWHNSMHRVTQRFLDGLRKSDWDAIYESVM